MANNRIKFKHFLGSLDKWSNKKTSGAWDNSIVFGRIYSDDGKWLYKIYAGTLTDGSGDKSLYEYNFVSVTDFEACVQEINALKNTLNTATDPITGNTVFTDNDFKNALKNTINALFSNNGKDLEQRLEAVEDAVFWVTTEDID